MRYEDARLLRETENFWLPLRLLWAQTRWATRRSAYGNLNALSDHDLQDIGLTRREAETGKRQPPVL